MSGPGGGPKLLFAAVEADLPRIAAAEAGRGTGRVRVHGGDEAAVSAFAAALAQTAPGVRLVGDASACVDVFLHDTGADLTRAFATVREKTAGAVVARVTDFHVSRSWTHVICPPKSGGHLLMRLITSMGYATRHGDEPSPGSMYFVNGLDQHADTELVRSWHRPDRRLNRFFARPAVLLRRDPRDIALSIAEFLARPPRDFATGERSRGLYHALHPAFLAMPDDETRLAAVIEGHPPILGIRELMLGYAGWMAMPNVLTVAYEDLAGSDAALARAIWRLQLHLHAAGSAGGYAAMAREKSDPTYNRGVAGRYLDAFSPGNRAKFLALPRDFLAAFGYGDALQFDRPVDFAGRGDRAARLARRLTAAAEWCGLPASGKSGIRVAAGIEDVESGVRVRLSDGHEVTLRIEDTLASEFAAVASVMEFLVSAGLCRRNDGAKPMTWYGVSAETVAQAEAGAASTLAPEGHNSGGDGRDPVAVEPGFRGANLVRFGGRYFAVPHSLGPIDLGSLPETELAGLVSAPTLDHARLLWSVSADFRAATDQMRASVETSNHAIRQLEHRASTAEARAVELSEENARLRERAERAAERESALTADLARTAEREAQLRAALDEAKSGLLELDKRLLAEAARATRAETEANTLRNARVLRIARRLGRLLGR